MKNIKRRYVYSVLALPLIAVCVYAATLSPLDRSTFFSEFKHKTVVLFMGEPEAEVEGLSASGDAAGVAASDGGAGGGGPGGDGGGFDPAAVFARRDADGDGKLTGNEISERMQQNIDQIDADQDGSVTLAEFQAGIQQMRASRGDGGDDQGTGVEGPGDGAGEREGDRGSDGAKSSEGTPDQPQPSDTEE